ncbi:hypothetical protein J4219_09100 [Candidatus Woesearchaeota archaeon]|nr:hypothetical protein [Candidatus Woesearchaeota archaeon]
MSVSKKDQSDVKTEECITPIRYDDARLEDIAQVYVGRCPERKEVRLIMNLEYKGQKYGTVSVCSPSSERDCWKNLARGAGKTLKTKGAKKYELNNGRLLKDEDCLPLEERLLQIVHDRLSETLNGYLNLS